MRTYPDGKDGSQKSISPREEFQEDRYMSAWTSVTDILASIALASASMSVIRGDLLITPSTGRVDCYHSANGDIIWHRTSILLALTKVIDSTYAITTNRAQIKSEELNASFRPIILSHQLRFRQGGGAYSALRPHTRAIVSLHFKMCSLFCMNEAK